VLTGPGKLLEMLYDEGAYALGTVFGRWDSGLRARKTLFKFVHSLLSFLFLQRQNQQATQPPSPFLHRAGPYAEV